VWITTDDWPDETTWSLRNVCTSQVATSGGPYSLANTLYTVKNCLPSARYAFTINDIYGDGICCTFGSGSYAVVVNGVTTLTGGQFLYTKTETFGSSCSVSHPSPVVAFFFNHISLVRSLIFDHSPSPMPPKSPPANLVRASQHHRSP
jgi:hypothetical protein